ncbi:alpha-mannosidase, partial [bacterium]|nr:alpha-mannosidase [bacterium]
MTEPSSRPFRMIGHAHIDPVWRWNKTEGIAEVLATFQSAIDRLREFPETAFIASSAQFYEWVRQMDPALFADIQRLVQAERWNLVGGWWVEADVNIPDGESLVRQGLYGQRFFRRHFGRKAHCGFSPDTFGHPHTLPQILAGQDLPVYFFMRPDPLEKPGLPGLIFRWQSPDAAEVLAFRILQSYNTDESELESRLAAFAGYDNLPYPIFYGVGNHGGGPTKATISKIRDLMQTHPEIRFTSLDAYSCEIERMRRSWPLVSDELHNHSRGCYSAHSGIKLQLHKAEKALLTAEKMQWICAQALPGAPVRLLTAAWEKVLFNQFHDILCGTSIESAYDESCVDLAAAENEAAECLSYYCRRMVQAIATDVFPPQASPFVLFNPHTFPVHEWVEVEMQRPLRTDRPALLDADGAEIPYQAIPTAAVHVPDRIRLLFRAALPSMGYRTYAVDFSRTAAPSPAGVSYADGVLQNEVLAVTFNPSTGFIDSLYDKILGREYLSGPASAALVLEDRDDTWGHETLAYDQVIGCFEQPQFTVLEKGPERCCLQISWRYGDSRLVQRFSLTREGRHLDVRVRLHWGEALKMLKLSFATVMRDGEATFSTPFGFIARPMNGEEQPGQSWIDISGRDQQGAFGFSLLSEGKYGYSVLPGEIRLTVLHSPIWSHHRPM